MNKCKNLTYLYCSYCKYLENIKGIANSNIKYFTLNGSKVQDIKPLLTCSKLEYLRLTSNRDIRNKKDIINKMSDTIMFSINVDTNKYSGYSDFKLA